jgi:hypothetical protein
MKLGSSYTIIAALIFNLFLLMGLSDASFLSPARAAGHPTSESPIAPTAYGRNSASRAKEPSKTRTTPLMFSGNSEVMLNTVCQYVPWPFRSVAKTTFLKELQGLVGQQHEITETHVYQVVLKLTPIKFHPQTMELLDHFKTVSTPTN